MAGSRDGFNDETHRLVVAHGSSRRLSLLLVGGGADAVYPLPESGSVTIGRAPDCEVQVINPSVSRRHAVLEIGPPLCIRDLGSANGVYVAGQRIAPNAPVALALGETITLGSVAMVLQGSAPTPIAALPPRAPAPVRPAAPAAQGVLTRDPAMQRVYELVDRVAAGTISVLLLGETGVGKEVVAEAVHRRSPRASGPFVKINCGALSATLLESELFGHERGAFTGAAASKPGLIESADGGTLFLDELGEMPMVLQVKLLRVLEERAVMRVGALRPRPVDVRFVAATNRDLTAEIARGAFRQDLYFRLNGVSIAIPPLRERLAEIEPLAELFVSRARQAAGLAHDPVLSEEARAVLRSYRWPGNVRELRNAMERAVLLCGGGPITPAHLPSEILAPAPPLEAPAEAVPRVSAAYQSTMVPPPPQGPDSSRRTLLRSEMAELERQRIIDALDRCGGNQTRAAEMLGIPRRTFVTRLKEYDIPRRRWGTPPSDE